MDRVQHEIPNRLADRQREDQSDRIGRFSNLDESRGSRYRMPFLDPFQTWLLRITEILTKRRRRSTENGPQRRLPRTRTASEREATPLAISPFG